MIKRGFLVALCATAACGVEMSTGRGDGKGSGSGKGDGSGSGSGGGGGMTATQFLAQVDHKVCDEAFACKASFPTGTGVTFDQAWGASTPQCYADSAAQDMPAQVESEIGAGKIHFDATAAAQCAGGVMFGTCAAFWTNGPAYPAACDQALVGTIADGGECVVDYDCASATSGCDPTLHVCIPSSAPRTTSRYASHVAAIFAK